MAVDGFGAVVANLTPPQRRAALDLKRQITQGLALYLPLAGGTLTGPLILPVGGELTLASTTHPLQIGPSSAANLAFDVNEIQARNNGAAATLVLQEAGGETQIGGNLRLGGSAGPAINTDGNYIHLAADSDVYLDGGVTYFRNAAGVLRGYFDSNGFRLEGTRSLYFPTYNGGWFMQDTTWLRSVSDKNIYTAGSIRVGSRFDFDGTGYKFTHSTDTDTGLYYYADGNMGLVSNGVGVLQVYGSTVAAIQGSASGELRLYDKADGNHTLKYSAATPTGSGSASNGPMLQGYSSAWLHTVSNDKSCFLLNNGNLFLSAGGSYTNFSSRRLKKKIKTLKPEVALDQVSRWRPVTFDWRASQVAHPHDFGFIAEEMDEVTPELCSYAENDGHAEGIDYGKATPILAGAVQALLARVEKLEARIVELEAMSRG